MPLPEFDLSPRASRAVALAAAGVLAISAAWAGTVWLGYPGAFELREPELSGLPASDVARAAGRGPRLAARVVMFLVDGLTVAASRELPNLEELRGRGAALQAEVDFPTYSMGSAHALVTGVDAAAAGVRLNHHPWPSRFDTIAARARAAGLRTALVGNDRCVLGRLFPRDFDLVRLGPGFERALVEALGPEYALAIVYFADPDLAGHRHGAAAPEYRQAARRVDARIGRLLERVDLAHDAVVVVSDHGHLARGGHGGVEPEVRRVPLVLAGAGVRRGVSGEARLIDVAPTVTALLGLPPPGQTRGRPLLDVLDVVDRDRALVWQSVFWARARSERFLGGLWRARRALDVKRDEALRLLAAGHYDAAYRAGEVTVREEHARAEARARGRAAAARRSRAFGAGAKLLLAVAVLLVLGRLGIVRTGAAPVLGFVGPAIFGAGYVLTGGRLSLSAINVSMTFFLHLGLLWVGAGVVHFAILAIALGRRGPERARRAAALGLWSALVAGLPAIACSVVAGTTRVVDLPPPVWAFLPALAYPLATAMAAAAAFFTLVEGRAR